MKATKKVISSVIVRILNQLIRILLRYDIPYGTFANLAKWVYVDVAASEFGIPGRKQTDSRIAVITGLTRKEVKRMKEMSRPVDLTVSDRYNRAARVIGGWLNDNRFLDSTNEPMELPFEGDEVSFTALVKAYSGDVPPRAVRDELLRAGVISTENGNARLLAKGYIVREGDIELLEIMGIDTSEFLDTFRHNIERDPSEAYLQRKVSYDNIPDDALHEVKTFIEKKGRELVETVDKKIASYDRDINPSVDGRGRNKAGLGVFYFQEGVKRRDE